MGELNSDDKSLGDLVSDVSEKASTLVREEIELAKAEVTQKVTQLARGSAIAAAAGVFLVFGVTPMFFFFVAFILNDLFNWNGVWPGFLVVTIVLLLLAAVAALIAYKLFQKGGPPTPDLAIEEAKQIRAELEAQVTGHTEIDTTPAKTEEVRA